jgi:DNA invertase Pin-like site-specific DNA recombinase
MIIGYARVSIDGQNLDAQTDALTAAGARKLFADKISGSKRERFELDRMLDQLRDGNVMTVTKYDRLDRSLADDLDTTTPAGRLMFHVSR